MTFKEFIYNVICPQATLNGNSVAIDDFNREGTKEYSHPKEFIINGDKYSWSISKRHTKGRHLCNHYELWFHGKAFNNFNGKIATGELTKGKLKKGYKIIYDYYYNNGYKGLCPQCEKEEINSHTLTDGLCLNCYHKNLEERHLADLHDQHNYEEGYF